MEWFYLEKSGALERVDKAVWERSRRMRHVGHAEGEGWGVTTIFCGRAPAGEDPPHPYESRIRRTDDTARWRYASRQQAERGHEVIVESLLAGVEPKPPGMRG